MHNLYVCAYTCEGHVDQTGSLLVTQSSVAGKAAFGDTNARTRVITLSGHLHSSRMEQTLGQTAFTGTVVPLRKLRCTIRSRGNVAMRAVAAPAKLATRKSEQVRPVSYTSSVTADMLCNLFNEEPFSLHRILLCCVSRCCSQ